MKSFRFVSNFCSQSCLQNAACRGRLVWVTYQSHIPGAPKKEEKKGTIQTGYPFPCTLRYLYLHAGTLPIVFLARSKLVTNSASDQRQTRSPTRDL
jgi:hypothetical protein